MAKKLLSVSKLWGTPAPQFDTYIPSLGDAANIEDAFKIFMYGTAENGGESSVEATSLYSSLVSIKTIAESADELIEGHNSASAGVHGLSAGAAVVGTTSAQTLTNKTLTNPVIPSISGNTSFSGSVSVSGNIVGHIDILDKTSTYTLALADDGKLIQMNSASVNYVNVPLNSSAAFPIGTQIIVTQAGNGQTIISPEDVSVILNSTPGLKLRAKWSVATLIKTGTNSWLVTGDLSS